MRNKFKPFFNMLNFLSIKIIKKNDAFLAISSDRRMFCIENNKRQRRFYCSIGTINRITQSVFVQILFNTGIEPLNRAESYVKICSNEQQSIEEMFRPRCKSRLQEQINRVI